MAQFFSGVLIFLAGVYSWGVGDAFAALIGKKYGKHKIIWKLADNKKSVEGSVAMLVTSAVSYWFDLIGTICVSAYLIFTGVTSFISEIKKQNINKK